MVMQYLTIDVFVMRGLRIYVMKIVHLKIINTLLTLLLISCFSPSVFADNVKPPTGDKAVYGSFTINITDETGGEFDLAFEALLTDIASGNTYTYTISFEQYVLGMPLEDSILANTTYTLEFRYPQKNDYAVFDNDSSGFAERFHMTEKGYVTNWSIRSALPYTEGENAVPVPIRPGVDGNTDSEAAIAYSTFYETVKHMDGNNAYEGFFALYGTAYEKKHAARYVEFVGGTEDEWYGKSFFERFLWYDTYIEMMVFLHSGVYDYYFKNLETFLENGIYNTSRLLGRVVGDKESDAYISLMTWQYEYIINHGKAYNFLGLNSSEADIGNAVAAGTSTAPAQAQTISASSETSITTQDTTKSTTTAPVSTVGFTEASSNSFDKFPFPQSPGGGIWDKTVDKLKNMGLTFFILFITLGAFICVVIYRKRKNVSDIVSDNIK